MHLDGQVWQRLEKRALYYGEILYMLQEGDWLMSVEEEFEGYLKNDSRENS